MSADEPGPLNPRELVAEVITAPETGRTQLPSLLGLLDVGDRQVRLGAVTALCAVADDHPATVGYLARRLLDRAGDDEALEVDLALEYLAARFPEAVGAELDAAQAVSGADRSLEELLSSPARTTIQESGRGGPAVGRTESIAERSTPGPEVHTEDDEERQFGLEESSDDEQDGTIQGDPTGVPAVNDADWFSIVEFDSRFDRLAVLAPRERRRYSDLYRAIGTVGNDDYGVAIRLLDTPDRDTEDFRAAIETRLDDWAAVSHLENVVSLYDWGHEPMLWATAEYTDETLADRDRFEPLEAAWHAEQIAATVSSLHERGIVHAGIDPENVAYYGNVLAADERQSPLLDNVGTIRAYRHFTDPATYLDPRYAAPEYYERRFGRIDHATDIYHLGAVCFRLFTGRPPYAGDFSTVRDRVLHDDPPTPSDVADVPPGVDDLVGKAMGKRKLARYESVAHLTQEIGALKESVSDDGG